MSVIPVFSKARGAAAALIKTLCPPHAWDARMKQQTGFIWRSLVLAIGLVLTPTSAMAQQAPPPAFQRCSACHAVTANAPAGVGPNLHGVFGRRAGSGPGFDCSDA